MNSHHGHPRRPSIGLSPDVAVPTAGSPTARYELKAPYAEAVMRAGGLPFVLPHTDDPHVIDGYLDRVSGVVLTGGDFDIAPALYGEEPREGLGQLKPHRTSFELALLRGALSRRMPVLGICGGMQLINVAFGGTLYQDIPLELPEARRHQQDHDRTQPQHPVDVKDGTQLSDAMGKGQVMVNSTHHQAVKAVGAKLVVSATALDGVVEAIEAPAEPFVVGVQWHPEMLVDSVPPNMTLFKAFVGKARERRR